MSTNFLTVDQAASKLGVSAMGSSNFATRANCISMGADATKLASYSDNQFPIDDNIIKGTVTKEILFQMVNFSMAVMITGRAIGKYGDIDIMFYDQSGNHIETIYATYEMNGQGNIGSDTLNVFGNTQYAWIPSSTKITKIGFRLLPQSTIGSPGITPQSNSSITARYLPSGRTLANYFSVAGDPCYYQVVLQEAFNSDDTLLITNVGTGGYLDWTINGTY